jgi:hypothetical protein
VLRHTVEHARVALAQRFGDLANLRRSGIQRATDNQENTLRA